MLLGAAAGAACRMDLPCPPCLAFPFQSPPHLACHTVPRVTGPCQSSPAPPRPPRRAAPVLTTPCLPILAGPCAAAPIQATPCLPHRAGCRLASPRPAQPRLPCFASPCRALPSRAKARLPSHAAPCVTPPCHDSPGLPRTGCLRLLARVAVRVFVRAWAQQQERLCA